LKQNLGTLTMPDKTLTARELKALLFPKASNLTGTELAIETWVNNNTTIQSDFTDFWSHMANLLMLQAIGYQTSVGTVLEQGAIGNALLQHNGALSAHITSLYTLVFIRTTLDQLLASGQYHVVDMATVKTEYLSLLNGSYTTDIKSGSNNTVTPWEVFHHWVKIIGLGGGSDISSTISTFFTASGLSSNSAFDAVNSTHYTTYTAFMPYGGPVSYINQSGVAAETILIADYRDIIKASTPALTAT